MGARQRKLGSVHRIASGERDQTTERRSSAARGAREGFGCERFGRVRARRNAFCVHRLSLTPIADLASVRQKRIKTKCERYLESLQRGVETSMMNGIHAGLPKTPARRRFFNNTAVGRNALCADVTLDHNASGYTDASNEQCSGYSGIGGPAHIEVASRVSPMAAVPPVSRAGTGWSVACIASEQYSNHHAPSSKRIWIDHDSTCVLDLP